MQSFCDGLLLFFYRLTVVVVKTRNLRPENDENENRHDVLSDLQNIFVKVKKINFASFGSADVFARRNNSRLDGKFLGIFRNLSGFPISKNMRKLNFICSYIFHFEVDDEKKYFSFQFSMFMVETPICFEKLSSSNFHAQLQNTIIFFSALQTSWILIFALKFHRFICWRTTKRFPRKEQAQNAAVNTTSFLTKPCSSQCRLFFWTRFKCVWP